MNEWVPSGAGARSFYSTIGNKVHGRRKKSAITRQLARALRASAVSVPVVAFPLTAAANTSSTWTNSGGNNLWSNALNWNPATVPNGTFDVTIGAPTPANLDTAVSVDTLTLLQAGALNIFGGNSLTVAGGSLSDAGTIEINSNNTGSATVLNFSASATISGGGVILMNGSGGQAQLDGDPTAVVTQAAGHTIEGSGLLNAILTNNGLVQAMVTNNGSLLTLQTNNKTNPGTLQAAGGATLDISGITVNNAGGTITATTGGVVNLDGNASISAGTLTTGPAVGMTAAGVIQNVSGTTTLTNVTLSTGSAFNALGGTVVDLAGTTLTNNGTVTVNANNTGSATFVTAAAGANVTLGGSGTLLLNGSGGQAQLSSGAGATLTNSSTHTIQGAGQINAALTNHGIVNATSTHNGSLLTLLASDETNTGMLEATSGTLEVGGITINNAGGTILASGNNVLLDGGTSVTGGILTSSGSNVIQVNSGTVTLTTPTLTTGTQVNVMGGTQLNITGPALSNAGIISVNPNNTGSATILNLTNNTTASAGSTILLNGSGGQAQLNTSAGATFTQPAGSIIVGAGIVSAALVNNGLLQAAAEHNGNTLTLQGLDKTNNSTFSAVGGATLSLSNSGAPSGTLTITQGASGQILADASTVQAGGNINVVGGALNTANGGTITIVGGVNTLTGVTNNGTLNINGGAQVNIAGGTLPNNGAITVNANNTGSATVLDFTSNTALSGTGTITLNGNGGQAQLNSESGAAVTQAAGHTIVGAGQINAALTNNGLVQAAAEHNGSILTLQGLDKTNNATFSAVGGATLNLSNSGSPSGTLTITQSASAQILADASTVQAGGNVNIVGGSLNTPNGGTFVSLGGINTLTGVTNNGIFNINGGAQVNIAGGGLINKGAINVNVNNTGSATVLDFTSNTALSGTGTITLNGNGGQAQLNSESGAAVTQAAGHTIVGAGQINAALTNNGLVQAAAEHNGSTLTLLANNKINAGTFQAAAGATLEISGITVNNAGGTITASTGGAVNLDSGASISGGTLTSGAASGTTAAGVIQNVSGTNTLTSVTLSSGSAFNILGGSAVNVAGTGLTNHGTITVNANNTGSGTLLSFPAGTVLTGDGALASNVVGSIKFAHNASFVTETVGSISTTGNASVDLANNHLDVQYGANPSPDATVRSLLVTGYAGGNWNGPGLNSSDAAANHQLALGYANGADGVVPGLAAGHELVRLAPAGDVNLDGVVNFSDLLLLAQHYGQSNARWDIGDLNYDGTVNFPDLLILAQTYGQTITPAEVTPLAPQFVGMLWPVPEPATAALLALSGAVALPRRRRALASL